MKQHKNGDLKFENATIYEYSEIDDTWNQRMPDHGYDPISTLTVRDYFAGLVLPYCLGNSYNTESAAITQAYEIADKVVRERNGY